MKAVTPIELPEQFGPYRILKQLGQGGMGSVFLAEDTRLHRKVALKVAHLSAERAAQQHERFLREARSAAALQHANLCPVHDFGEIRGIHYLVMAYIEGPTLAEWQAKARPRPPKEAASLVAKLALAMDEAHQAGVIHRDLKPANIKITARGELVILDFGLAQRTEARELRLTQTGTILGTPAYMAPEQVLGQKQAIGPASDIYALGVILYELLTARLPFEAEEITPLLIQIAQDSPPPPSTYRPDLDPRLDAICLKALAKKPEERFASMKEFARALIAFVRSEAQPDAVVSATQAMPPPKGHASPAAPGTGTPKKPPRQAAAVPETWSAPGKAERPGRRLGKGCLIAGCLMAVPVLLVPLVLVGLLIGSGKPGATTRPTGGPVVVENEPPKPDGPPTIEQKPPKDGDRKPRPIEKEIVNSIGMKLVLIPAGKFWMGSPSAEKGREGRKYDDVSRYLRNDDNELQHEVEITRPFYLGVCEVTQEEYQKVMGTNPSYFSSTGKGSDMVQGTDTKRFPVESVPWPAVWEFCRRLSKLPEEENAGREYRLPTEAEWEYACRGGSTSTETLPFHVGAMLFPHQANCWDSELRRTTTVGSYRPNAFGLYDMHGNVREWCSDWHGPYPTDSKLQQDPQGPLHGSRRILRGGSWLDGAAYCRAAVRHEANPKAVDFDKAQGFRVVCILPSQIP